MINKKINEKFNFELLIMLVQCNAKISSSVQDQLVIFLKERTSETIDNNGSRIVFPRRTPYDELNLVGLWCFNRKLPSQQYSLFLGKSAWFDFFYSYTDFDLIDLMFSGY